jgi:CheY-like chemotaxis protein
VLDKKIISSKVLFVEAKSGEEAIAQVRDTAFDVIVLDQHMGPGMKGTEVMRNLKTSGNNAALIGYSGNDMSSDHRDAGAVLSWTKPLPSDVQLKTDLCLALAVRRKLIASGSQESLTQVFGRLM